ncbi:MAG: hypothetical protein U1F55_07275 [Chitinivorax sp.]
MATSEKGRLGILFSSPDDNKGWATNGQRHGMLPPSGADVAQDTCAGAHGWLTFIHLGTGELRQYWRLRRPAAATPVSAVYQ